MTTTEKYSYTTLRYVHDIVTGEFVNIGTLFVVPHLNYINFEVRTSTSRLKHLFPNLDVVAFRSAVKATKRSVDEFRNIIKRGDFLGEFPNAHAVAHRALPQDESSLQWADMSSGLTDNPERTFKRIYDRFVWQYDTMHPSRRSDDEVWRTVRQKLDEKNLQVDFSEKIVASKADEIVFKKAWKNGVWHAYEPLSFDLADADGIKDKARRWRGHLEAVHTGTNNDIKLYFVVGAPQNEELNLAYENALQILRDAAFHPSIFKESDADQLVAKIEDDVRFHLNGDELSQ